MVVVVRAKTNSRKAPNFATMMPSERVQASRWVGEGTDAMTSWGNGTDAMMRGTDL